MITWKWVVGAGAALSFYNAVIGGLALAARNDYLSDSIHDAEVAAATITFEVMGILDQTDRSLSALGEVVQVAPDMLIPGNRDAHHLLMRRHAATPVIKSLFLVSPDGVVINSSFAAEPPTLNLGDRDYFRDLRRNADDAMVVGGPVSSRRDGGMILPAVRMIHDQFGRPTVVVAAAIALSALEDVVARSRMIEGSRVAIQFSDGRLMACTGMPGCRTLALSLPILPLPATGQISGPMMSVLPGKPGPGAVLRDDGRGLTVSVVIEQDRALKGWRAVLPGFIALALLGSLAILLGLAMVRRQISARNIALAALARANHGLENRVEERTRELRESEARLGSFIEAAHDGVIITDSRGVVTEFNPAAQRLFGYLRADVIGGDICRLLPDCIPGQGWDPDGGRMAGRRKDGSLFPVEVSTGSRDVEGRSIHVGVLRDITGQKAHEEKLNYLASIDGLTGVLNRRSFMERAHWLFQEASSTGRDLAVLMIDADHFKSVNDRHGHAAGDAVLTRLGGLISGNLRQTDMAGRLGGEEFAAILPETGESGAKRAGNAVVQILRDTPIDLPDGSVLSVTVSVGVAVLMPGDASFDEMLARADAALYRAKNNGRDQLVFA